MNHLFFSRPIKKGLQATLLLAILLFNFGPGSTLTAYAAPPSNDNFVSAIEVLSIPFTSSISTVEATNETGEPVVNVQCDGKFLQPGYKTVWYKYTPGANELVSFDTYTSNYDTYLAVWTGSWGALSLVACDDDTNAGLQSQMLISATLGVPYYIEVAEYAGTVGGPPEIPAGGSLKFHVNYPNINISLAGIVVGSFMSPEAPESGRALSVRTTVL